MMPHIPTFSGANPDVPNYGAYHGFVRTRTRLGNDAAAGASLSIFKDTSRGVLRPVLTLVGRNSGIPPNPGTYDPMSPSHGLFFAVPYNEVAIPEFPFSDFESVLRARLRSPETNSPGIDYSATPENVWVDPAKNGSSLSWNVGTQNYVGYASVLLDLAFSGNTNDYQTYLIQNGFTA